MSALKHSELFDFDRYTAEIKNVQQVTLDFGTTVDSVLARVGAQQKALTAQLKDYAAALKNFNVGSPGAGAGLTGFNTQVSNTARSMNDLKAIQQGLASVTNLQRASITQLEAEYKGLNAQLKNLVPGTQGYEAEVNRLRGRLAEVIPKLQAFSSAVTAQKKIIEGAEGSYRRMQAQLGFLRTQLRDMPGAFNASTGAINKNNKEAVALDREIKRLANTLGNADKQMALYHRNVGNYSSAFKGFGSGLLQYATTVLSLTTAFNVLNQSLDFSAKFQSLNTALRALSGSSEEFAQTQQFLSGLANK